MSVSSPHVAAEKRGSLGLLTLRRPDALNALTLDMVRALTAALDAWAADGAVRAVAIRGESARAFCAGGDIRAWVAGGPEAALEFLRAEYALNARIAEYPKPFAALMHGIVMGGGAGLSVHARYRVADASLVFAMPETAIGFVPDIGATHFLPRCPDGIGLYLALTAGRIGLADAKAVGLVTHAVTAPDFEGLIARIADGEAMTKAIDALAAKPAPGLLAPHARRLATWFGAPSVEAVLERLARDNDPFARATADAIRANAPLSLKLIFQLLRRGADLGLRDCLRQEYRAAAHLFARPDLKEGVRAAVIDKDRAPKWQPAVLAAVREADVEACLTPLGVGELSFPGE